MKSGHSDVWGVLGVTEITVHRMAAGTFLMQAEGHGNLPSPTAHSLLSELGTL